MKIWKPKHLLMGWIAWWSALALWGIGSTLPAVWRATRPNAVGNINVSCGDAGFSATVSQAGHTTWQGTVSLTMLSLLIAAPPLLMWLFWLRSSHSRPSEVDVIGQAAEPFDVTSREHSRSDG